MPQFIGQFRDRMTIADWLECGQGLIGGSYHEENGSFCLRDSSASWRVPPSLQAKLPPAPAWVALRGSVTGPHEVVYAQARQISDEVRGFQSKADTLIARRVALETIRRFFLDASFIEMDTPIAVPCPGMEPYLDSFPVEELWLRTSPELHMKRLLAGGFDRIFQMAPCFRKGDKGRWHREEFLMLEWYRAFADLNHLIEDVGKMLEKLAPLAKDRAYFERHLEVVSCAELFERELDVRLADNEDREPLRACLHRRGITYDENDDWDTLYFLAFLNFIESKLGQDRPTIVVDYPASMAALAKLAPANTDSMPTCYRFELYIKGQEIANAFYELTDEAEQRQRFVADQDHRTRLGKPVYALDEPFLSSLKSGLPPSAGIALGLDRLIVTLLGETDLAAVLPF